MKTAASEFESSLSTSRRSGAHVRAVEATLNAAAAGEPSRFAEQAPAPEARLARGCRAGYRQGHPPPRPGPRGRSRCRLRAWLTNAPSRAIRMRPRARRNISSPWRAPHAPIPAIGAVPRGVAVCFRGPRTSIGPRPPLLGCCRQGDHDATTSPDVLRAAQVTLRRRSCWRSLTSSGRYGPLSRRGSTSTKSGWRCR